MTEDEAYRLFVEPFMRGRRDLTWPAGAVDELCKQIVDALAAKEAVNAKLRNPFRHADDQDWDYIHHVLVCAMTSQEDQCTRFWLEAMQEARAVFAQSAGQGE